MTDLEVIDDVAPLWRIKLLYTAVGALSGLIVGGLLAWWGLS